MGKKFFFWVLRGLCSHSPGRFSSMRQLRCACPPGASANGCVTFIRTSRLACASLSLFPFSLLPPPLLPFPAFLFPLFCLSFLLKQEFQRYMRRRASRPAIEIAGFDPASVVVDQSPSTWVDLFGQPASPPPLNKLPQPESVISGAALPYFEGLRLRNPATFRCGNLHQFAHTWDSFMGGVRGYEVIRP